MSDYDVTSEALREDAQTWRGWADRLQTISQGIPWTLDQDVYGLLPGVDGVFTAFRNGVTTLSTYIESGHAEFEAIADALVASAAAYEQGDADLSVDVHGLSVRTGLQ